MSEPLVSVLIPGYNAGRTLADTLASVLAQTWPRVETVVVDDGSADDTLDVARRFEGEGVRVIAQANAGASAARNAAYRASSGDFVQFLDADDLLAPDKIERQVRRLLAEPERTIATGAWARFYGDAAEAVFELHPDFRDYDDPLEWRLQAWEGRGTMPPLAWLLPRAVVDDAGPWHEGLSLDDDGEYFTRVLLACRRVAFCADARGFYRSGLPSLSGRRDRRALDSLAEAARLSTARVLERTDTPRARQAAACYWQMLLFVAYPDAPDLVREAERKVEALGGGHWSPDGGSLFNAVRDVIGWKPALRLQRWYYRLRYTGAHA